MKGRIVEERGLRQTSTGDIADHARIPTRMNTRRVSMLEQGDKAPAFSLESDAGKTVSLADFAGKTLVVYFYPKDDTPGCTREAIAFSGALDRFAKAGAAVVGISKDSVKSHAKFRAKYALAIPLLSDPDLKVHEAFGAYGEKTMYGKKVMGTIRSTFVIGPDGKVARVFPSVKVDGHEEAVLAAVGAGGSPAPKPAAKAAPKPAAKKAAAKPAAKAAPKPAAKAAKPAAKAAPKPAAKKAAAKPAAKKSAAKKS
jgi:peroxiredoxin Q/BCP